MTKTIRGFVKGAWIGIMLGCAAGIIGSCYVKDHRRGVKKNVGKALHSVSSLVESVTSMF